jgi:adenine phosphoribosyltransferase
VFRSCIRTIPDHPKPGIQFRDITTLFQDAKAFRAAVDRLTEPFRDARVDKVAGIEARGFILGGAVAHQLATGFVPVRKEGKLPWRTLRQEYALEYGTDTVEIHEDAVRPDDRVLVVDDLIATGGTAEAAMRLIARVGGRIVGGAFVIELPELGGRKRIEPLAPRLVTLCEFEGD